MENIPLKIAVNQDEDRWDTSAEKYNERVSIEGKNAEFKRFHEPNRARGYGLLSVSKQSKLAAIAVNIKKIAAFHLKERGYL